ncbi:MAG TPA: MAPEG family protein [Caulobacterales bacterium]|nr:MAPEG family protein [Caulobacterales bacterium]
MSTELNLLTYSVALLFVLIMIQALAGVFKNGSKVMAGNRDSLPPDSVWMARTKRVVANHIENLAVFAPIVLVAALARISNQWTVLGAQLFFYSRLAHAIIYLAGWPWIRAVAWTVGLVGIVLIFLALFGILQ